MPLNSDQLKNLINSSNKLATEPIIDIIYSNVQDEQNEKVVISVINDLLSSAKTREKGLELVNLTIPYYSLSVITDHSLNWVNYCMVNTNHDDLKEIKLKTLIKIMKISHETTNFNKKFVADYLLDTLKVCLSCRNNNENQLGLVCLTQCMQLYPSWFGNHTSKVETHLLKLLQNANEETLVKKAAIAFVYLQQTGAAGSESINHTSNFLSCFMKLCATVHGLFDSFLEGVNEIEQFEKIDLAPFPFDAIPTSCSSHEILQITAHRIVNCLVFLKYLIVKKYPAVKQIIPKLLVDLINRGMSLHVCLEGHVSLETTYLALFLKKIQLVLMDVFHVFVTGFSSHLLPFSYLVMKFMVNTLRRRQSCTCFDTDCLYHEWSYKILNNWLVCTKSSIQKHVQELLFSVILKDISPIKKAVVLNLQISKKGKGKRQNLTELPKTVETEGKLYIISKKVKENICISALTTLKYLLTTTAIKVKDSLMRDLYTFIIKTIMDVQANRHIHPYTNLECQIKLYSVVGSLFEQDNYFPPLHLVVKILNMGMTNSNSNIVQICTEGMQLLEKISQPICPSLDFITETTDVMKTINSNDLNRINEIGRENQIAIEMEERKVQEEEDRAPAMESEVQEEVQTTESKEMEWESKKMEVIDKIDFSKSSDKLPIKLKMDSSKIVEPPVKRKKQEKLEESEDLEKMLCTFKDFVQE